MHPISRLLLALLVVLNAGFWQPAQATAQSNPSFRVEVTAEFNSPFPEDVPNNGTYSFDTLSLQPDDLPVTELIAIDIINDGNVTLDFGADGVFKRIRQIPPGVTSLIDVLSGTLAPGQSTRIFLDPRVELNAQSGPYEAEIEIRPLNGFSHIFTVRGTIDVAQCDTAPCPGANIRVTDQDDTIIQGSHQVNPVPGGQQTIGFKILNIGDAQLNNISVSESGDSRFSVGSPLTPLRSQRAARPPPSRSLSMRPIST